MRLPFLRKASTGDEPLVVSMTGARLGDSVVFAGQAAALVLPLAARTGLSGRCLIVGPPDATAALEATATREGLLVETADRFPDDRSFELAVVEAAGDWPAATGGVRNAVRSGGRVVVVSGGRQTGLLSRFTATQPSVAAELIVRTLEGQGWQRTRSIGGRDGMSFVEAFA